MKRRWCVRVYDWRLKVFKWAAKWMLRGELAKLNRQVTDGLGVVESLSRENVDLHRAKRDADQEVERLKRLIDAQGNWHRLCALLTDPRDVEEAMAMTGPQWDEAVRAMDRNHPGMMPPQAHVIGVVRRAMREALHGLLNGEKVRFHFTVDRVPDRAGAAPIDLGAHVFVDRAEFHARSPSYLDRALDASRPIYTFDIEGLKRE